MVTVLRQALLLLTNPVLLGLRCQTLGRLRLWQAPLLLLLVLLLRLLLLLVLPLPCLLLRFLLVRRLLVVLPFLILLRWRLCGLGAQAE